MDESLWVLISFVAFVALVWKRAGVALSAMFDQRAQEIKTTLDEAKSLRKEAQAELNKYQRLHREAADEAEQITANALAAAEQIRSNAEAIAEAAIKRKEEQATAKIKAMEAEVTQALRERAAELATLAAAELITAKLDQKGATRLVKADIDKMKKLG